MMVVLLAVIAGIGFFDSRLYEEEERHTCRIRITNTTTGDTFGDDDTTATTACTPKIERIRVYAYTDTSSNYAKKEDEEETPKNTGPYYEKLDYLKKQKSKATLVFRDCVVPIRRPGIREKRKARLLTTKAHRRRIKQLLSR